jgi:putative transposase
METIPLEPGKCYHVYNHANGSESLFKSDENYRYFLRRFNFYISPVTDCYAYCLMPNHIHFLVRIKSEAELIEVFEMKASRKTSKTPNNLGDLPNANLESFDSDILAQKVSQQFSNLFNSYTKSFNKMYGRKGSLFIPNFKRKEITNQSYFINTVYYIHANPVHHGFAKRIVDWPWSSYQSMLLELPTKLKRKEVLDRFGSTDEYIKYHERPIDPRIMNELGF